MEAGEDSRYSLGDRMTIADGGVPAADMRFCGEPTSDFDMAGQYLRTWYEANRETWWDRQPLSRNQRRLRMGAADSFMLGLINEVGRIEDERKRQTAGWRQ